MPCYYPLHGFVARQTNASGKRSIVFDVHEGYSDRRVDVPCGRCIGCRLEYGRQWAMRCMHEASLHDDNCFITLTYDEAHLPPLASLKKTDFQKFMKRLRKRFPRERIRFYHCGEYGGDTRRPHYHALLFGFDFGDKTFWADRGDFRVYRSAVLEKLWPYGLSEIGCVTFESASYVARYMTKKFKGSDEDKDHYYSVVDSDGVVEGIRESEYSTMSRKPGIGKEWFDKFKEEVYNADSVIVRGREMKPPKYYDLQFDLVNHEDMVAVKRARKRARSPEDEDDRRLEARKTVAEAGINLFSRRKL